MKLKGTDEAQRVALEERVRAALTHLCVSRKNLPLEVTVAVVRDPLGGGFRAKVEGRQHTLEFVNLFVRGKTVTTALDELGVAAARHMKRRADSEAEFALGMQRGAIRWRKALTAWEARDVVVTDLTLPGVEGSGSHRPVEPVAVVPDPPRDALAAFVALAPAALAAYRRTMGENREVVPRLVLALELDANPGTPWQVSVVAVACDGSADMETIAVGPMAVLPDGAVAHLAELLPKADDAP